MKRAPAILLFALFLLVAAGGIWFLTQGGGDGASALALDGGDFEPLSPGVSSSGQDSAVLAGLEAGSTAAEASRASGAAEAGTKRRTLKGAWKPPITARWVEGRVEAEGGLPLDEKLVVVAEGRRFSSEADSPDTYRAEVEPDGTFRAAFAPDTRRGRMVVEGRYAFTKKAEVVKISKTAEQEEVVLEVELGGRIQVEVLPPKSAAFNDDVLDGIEVEARVGTWTQVPILKGKPVGTALFELGGARPDQAYQIIASSPAFADAKLEGVRVKAGEVTRVEVALTRGARIAGTVRNSKGEPILFGKVMAMPRKEAAQRNPFFNRKVNETEDLEGGSFEILGVRPGETMLVVEADGYLDYQQDLGELFDGDERSAISLVISRGGIVSGTVSWPDGAPAQGAEVRISQADAMGSFDFERVHDSAVVGADGAFEFSALKEGECAVTAVCIERGWELPEDASLADRKFGAKAPTWRVHEERISPGRTNLAITLEPGSTVIGVVVDDTGEPVPEFRITAQPTDVGFLSSNGVRAVKERFDNDKGKFQIEGLMAGKWTFSARASGYGMGTEREVRAPFDGEVRLTMPRAGTLLGTVRTPDGESAKDARVMIKHGDGREVGVNAGKGGEFKASKIDPGPVTLIASMDGYAKSLPVDLQVGADGKREDLILDLRYGARIVGTIHESVENRGGRKLQLRGTLRRNEESDDDGNFEFTGLEPGAYQLSMTPDTTGIDGRSRWIFEQANADKVSLMLTVGQVENVTMGEPPANAVRLTGLVVDEGVAVSGATVLAYPMKEGAGDDAVGAAKTNADGAYRMLLREPGDYRFHVGRQIGQLSKVEVKVPAVAEYEHNFELPEGVLRGKVIGPEGTGLTDVYLTLSPSTDSSSSNPWMRRQQTRSTAGGVFVFEDISPGEYDLRAASLQGRSDLANVLVQGVEVEEGSSPEVEVSLPRDGSAQGTVVGAEGNPVTNATVWVETEGGKRITEFNRNRSSSDGSFRLGSIAPGDAWLRASKGGVVGPPVKVRVSEGGMVQATLVVAPQ